MEKLDFAINSATISDFIMITTIVMQSSILEIEQLHQSEI